VQPRREKESAEVRDRVTEKPPPVDIKDKKPERAVEVE
jgi:hypothetical protein